MAWNNLITFIKRETFYKNVIENPPLEGGKL